MSNPEVKDRARDELFSHIHRCGVIEASPGDQDSWMTETIVYLAERYPELSESDLFDLKTIGIRFCQPVISRLKKEDLLVPTTEPEATADPSVASEPVAVVDGVTPDPVTAVSEAVVDSEIPEPALEVPAEA